MKAITVTETRIHCDACHHEFVGDPPEWHNKACPECGSSPIISDADMAYARASAATRDLINAFIGDVPEDAPTFHFTLDSKNHR